MVAFANDEALIIVGKDIKELEHFRDEAIEVVADWLSHQDLPQERQRRRLSPARRK